MFTHINLCTTVLPKFPFTETLEIASSAGYQGIELRVDDNYHQSLADLQYEGVLIKRSVEQSGLQLPVLSSYIPLNDETAIAKLLYCCQKMDVPKARVVLPRSWHAAVAQQAKVKQILPSYEARQEPKKLLHTLKRTLRHLEHKARTAGVKLLLELHWGTVMSSFSSAYFLIHDLDPDYIAVTFDPANMMVEGKEDWEFGIKLLQSHLANVHVKNITWQPGSEGWLWAWAPLTQGMVDWSELIRLLTQNHYAGDYAIEDFLALNTSKQAAIFYLTELRSTFRQLYDGSRVNGASPRQVRKGSGPLWRQPNLMTTMGHVRSGNGPL